MLDELYFGDPRVVLVPIEHLSPTGLSDEMTEALRKRSQHHCQIAEMVTAAFPLYWARTSRLSSRLRSWAPPRLRNIAIVDSSTAIPPYVQLLNTSTWTLFDCDCNPASSSVELFAYLLAHGDRMSLTGEATLAALHNAAYWFERTESEIEDFTRGATASTRPDAAALRALAAAIPWMRQLAHETLRPPQNPQLYRPIGETGLLVPRSLEREPPRLVIEYTRSAKVALQEYYGHYRTAERGEIAATLDWLREKPHSLVVTGRNNRILWDCQYPDRVGPLRSELRRAGAESLQSIRADLAVVDHHSQDFRDRCTRFDDLPVPDAEIGQDGYTYLYRGRRILAYNLHERHLDRLKVPALPFARAMLGARAYHEWCHLAVDAGWVTSSATSEELGVLTTELREGFDTAIEGASERIRRMAGADLAALAQPYGAERPVSCGRIDIPVAGTSAGAALVRLLLARAADFQANLLAARLQRIDEREVYVRQNIRSLRADYGANQIWRMLGRYLYELQYLRFSAIEDKRTYFLRSTWFDCDFLDSGILSMESFERLDRAWCRLFDTFAIDHGKIRVPPAPSTQAQRGP
jgi:hypothetical protein